MVLADNIIIKGDTYRLGVEGRLYEKYSGGVEGIFEVGVGDTREGGIKGDVK